MARIPHLNLAAMFMLSVLVGASSSAQQATGEYREFKDKQGRVVKARIVETSDGKVLIEREDGTKFSVAIANFSEADQAFINRRANGGGATGGSSDDENQFRGPNFGSKDAEGLPTEWNASTNVVWRTDLPGRGASSPITHGNRIFVTCYTGYGESQDAPGEKDSLRRHLICIDRQTGRLLWNKATPSRQNVSNYQGFVALHGFASSTPVCDGERVYCFFGSSGVYAFDLSGNELWNSEVGKRTHGFGTGSSPILADDLVIVNASVESGSLVAFDRTSGAEVWRAGNVSNAWGSPVIVEAGGRKEVVVDTNGFTKAFDVETGRELWRCAGSQPPRYICPTPIVHDGTIYAVHGYHGPLSAIQPGGSGDITDSHRKWTAKVSSNVPSPVFFNGYLYSVKSESGVFSCVNAKDGSVVYKERLRPAPGRIYGSPIAADGKIYLVSRDKGTFVVAAGPRFEQLSHNVIETDESIFNGSPVVSRNQLLLRSDTALYCIGRK